RLELFGGGDAASVEVGIALRDDLGVGGLRDVALQVRLRLQQRGLERAAVEREEDLAFRDVVAFLEIDGGQLTGDLRVNGHDRVGFDAADHANLDRHRFLHDGRDG